MPAPTTAGGVFDAHAYARVWRGSAGLLVALSRLSLPALLGLVVLATDPPIDLPTLLVLVAELALLPALAAWFIRRPCAARVELRASDLVVRRRDLVMEIPYAAIARVRPLPSALPAPGLSFAMRSGQTLGYVLELDDPAPLLRALAAFAADAAHAALRHPSVVYAHAAAAVPRWRWHHYLWKFVVFGLAPTAVLFNAHQHIAYGGTLGEYYLLGTVAYARTLALYWLTLTLYLVLFAGLWRVLAETAAWTAAWAAPEQAATVRRLAERSCQILYYAGVPALLAVRFLA